MTDRLKLVSDEKSTVHGKEFHTFTTRVYTGKKLKIYGKTVSAAFSNLRDRAAWATSLRIKSMSGIPRRPGDSIDWQAGDLMRGGG